MFLNDPSSSGENPNILVCEIGEMLFGIETHLIRMTTAFSVFDPSVVIKPYVGTLQLADDKIPLLNLNTFFKLPSVTDGEPLGGIIVTFNNRNFFSLIVSRIIGTCTVGSFYKFPAESSLYPDIYKSIFPFKDTYLLLLDLKRVFYHIIEQERKSGSL